jgi:predicted RND superfamily exporter protein
MQWEIQSDMTITSNKFKVILFTVVIVQFIFVFFWMNKNDSEFFELLALESPKNIDFINIYSDFYSYESQNLSGGYTEKDTTKMATLLQCIQSAKKVPRIEGEILSPERVVVIKFNNRTQYALQISLSSSEVGFTGKYYNYYDYSNGKSIGFASRTLRAECLYDWLR